MEKLLDVRNKWDDLLKENRVNHMVKIIGVICAYFSASAMLELSQFIELINPQLLILIPLAMAILHYFNESLSVFAFGVLTMLSLAGGNSAVVLIAGIVMLVACNCPRFVCVLAIVTPWLLMNIDYSENTIHTLGLGFMIFFMNTYFNEKLATNAWKYAFPVYFTLLAYNFGLYGRVVANYFGKKWPEASYTDVKFDPVQLFNSYAEYENSFLTLDITTLMVLIIINIVICYIMYKTISSKNIKFLNLQMDIRDLIAFGIAIFITIAGLVIAKNVLKLEMDIMVVTVIWQGMAAYFITRPFASYKVCESIKSKKSRYEEQQGKKAIAVNDYNKSIAEEMDGILETYLTANSFANVISADKYPINAVLITGKADLDKKLVIKNLLNKKGLNTEYTYGNELLNEYISEGKIGIFESIKEDDKLRVIVLDRIETLTDEQMLDPERMKSLVKYIKETMGQYITSKKILFILTTSCVEEIPESLFGVDGINKIVYAAHRDSLLLNNTYRLIKQIGKGGGGVVYKATHERLDVTVVVKRIIQKFSNKNSYKAEAEVLKKIKHTYLPKVYDVFEEDGEFYTVMDYISGSSLQEKLDKGESLSQESILKWTKQLAEAVGYLHDQTPPIIHSDIKPDNIMLTSDDDISLIDFNISLIFDKNNKSIGVTPGYSPIEQYGSMESYQRMLDRKRTKIAVNRDTASLNPAMEETVMLDDVFVEDIKYIDFKSIASQGIDVRSDIFSIGATVYALMTGEKPSVDFDSIKPLSSYNLEIAEEFVRVIEKAMSIDPADRYSSVADLRRALDTLEAL